MQSQTFKNHFEELNYMKRKGQILLLEKDGIVDLIEGQSSKYEIEVQGNDTSIEVLQNRIKKLKGIKNKERKEEKIRLRKSAFNKMKKNDL